MLVRTKCLVEANLAVMYTPSSPISQCAKPSHGPLLSIVTLTEHELTKLMTIRDI
jgi:hypothetical protein